MGNLKLRKIIKADTTWLEKNVERHKHNFSVHCILEEHSPNGTIGYFNVLKCDNCNSFKWISEDGNICGRIFNQLTDKQKQLPVIKGYKKHNNLIGFYDIEKIISQW